jgi:hypothetical protein
MIHTICLWIVILSPLFKGTDCYTQTKEKSADITATIVLMIITYLIYYYGGIFNLIK